MLFQCKILNKIFSLLLLCSFLSLQVLPAYSFYSQFIIPENNHEAEFLKNFEGATDILGALVASGVEPQNYSFYTSEIVRWKNEIEESLPQSYTELQLAQIIGYYLHDKAYTKYRLSATTLKEVFEDGLFNCLSATILMNILLRAFGIDAKSIVLPTHVYTLANLDGQNIEIENTIREGLSISTDKQAQDRFNKLTGFNYLDGQKKKVVIGWNETVGLLYSNRSYFNAQKNQHTQAFQNMMKAQVFLANTLSEQKNLIAGYLNYSYYTYKNNKASIQEYLKALSVLEEGIERFPSYENLKGNYLKGIDLVLGRMIDNNADKMEVDQLLLTSQKYLSANDFNNLQKNRAVRSTLYHLRTNKNYVEAKKYIVDLWNINKNDKDVKGLIQEFSYNVVQDDLNKSLRMQENSDVLNILQEFPLELTKESLGCYYSQLAKNNFDRNNFEKAVDIMLQSKEKVGSINLVVQNGFAYSVNSAQHFINSEEYDKAIEFYKKALQFKKDSGVINNLGILYERVISSYLSKNQVQEVKRLVLESKQFTPNHPVLKKLHQQYS